MNNKIDTSTTKEQSGSPVQGEREAFIRGYKHGACHYIGGDSAEELQAAAEWSVDHQDPEVGVFTTPPPAPAAEPPKYEDLIRYVTQPESRGVDVEAIRRACQSGKRFWQAGPGYYEEIESLLPATPNPVRVEQPEGKGAWKLVPVELDDAMNEAGEREIAFGNDFQDAYRAALAAAPAAPVGVDEAWAAKMRKYYEVTQHGIGMARMALLAHDMSKAKASLDHMSDEIDAVLASKAQEESNGK